MHLGLLLLLLPPLSLQCGISTHTEVGFRWIVEPFCKCIFTIHILCLSSRALEYFRHIGDNSTNSIR